MKEKLYVTINEDDDYSYYLGNHSGMEFVLDKETLIYKYMCKNCNDGERSTWLFDIVYLSRDLKWVTYVAYGDLYRVKVKEISSKKLKESTTSLLVRMRKNHLKNVKESNDKYNLMKKLMLEGKEK